MTKFMKYFHSLKQQLLCVWVFYWNTRKPDTQVSEKKKPTKPTCCRTGTHFFQGGTKQDMKQYFLVQNSLVLT